jgi:hypothetical protein
MAKENKRKLIFIMVFVMILLSSSTYAVLMPSAHASTIKSYQTQATSILSNVVELSMDAYPQQVISERNSANNPAPLPPTTLSTTNPSSALVSSLPRDEVIFNLTATQSRMRARCSFVNGKLNQISLYNDVGSPVLKQPTTNTLVMAQGFLERYQSFTGNSLYGSLSSMLNNTTLQTNVTKTAGNVMLQATVFDNQTENDLVWSYVDNNGNPAPMKDIVLSYRNGYLESFLDNWQLYQTVGVPTLSSQNAVATALQVVKNFSYIAQNADGTNFTVSDFKVATTFNVTLSYMNYDVQTPLQSTRGSDPYTLYPAWYVGVGFDKIYPDGITGLNIWVWADTGNLGSVEPMKIQNLSVVSDETVSSSSVATIQTETNQVPALVILSLIAASGVSGLMAVQFYGNKNKLAGFRHLWKMTSSKRKVAAFCLIVLPVTLIVAVPTVKASALKSELYASSWTINPPYEYDPWIPALQNYYQENEYLYASQITEYIQMLYQQYEGIDSTNNAGSGTDYSNIYENIIHDHYNYPGSVVFHFGPGGSPDTYIDSNGVTMSSMEIYYAAYGYSTISFVMMWSCNDAGYWQWNGNGYTYYYTQYFANAWTQTNNLRLDGFGNPDDSAHCFIGFLGESPSISYESFAGWPQVAGYWIEWFYYYAVYEHDTVHQALNDASNEVFGVPYNMSPLPQYYTYWPGGWMGEEYYPEGQNDLGAMEVYGDSNIYISEGGSDYVSAPSISSNVPNPGVALTAYQFGVSSTDSYGRNVAYKIFWGDGSSTMSSFYPSGETVYFNHSFSSGGQHTVIVYAESQYASWSSPSTYTVNLDDAYVWLTVNAYDAYLGEGSPSTTDVYFDSNYVGTVGTEPISIQVPAGDHTVTVDYRAYNMDWGGYETIYEITGNYDGYYNIYSETPVTVYLLITDDITVNAVYSMW